MLPTRRISFFYIQRWHIWNANLSDIRPLYLESRETCRISGPYIRQAGDPVGYPALISGTLSDIQPLYPASRGPCRISGPYIRQAGDPVGYPALISGKPGNLSDNEYKKIGCSIIRSIPNLLLRCFYHWNILLPKSLFLFQSVRQLIYSIKIHIYKITI